MHIRCRVITEGLNQSKTRASCSLEIDLVNLCSIRSYSKYLMMRCRHKCNEHFTL
jgi:hypothetical protein